MTTRISRGAAWLDQSYPGWYNKVNPAILNSHSDTNCVLGQVTGDFSLTMGKKHPVANFYWRVAEVQILPVFILMFVPGMILSIPFILWGVRHGFLKWGRSESEWADEWQQEILSRIDRDADKYSQLQKMVPLARASDLATSA